MNEKQKKETQIVREFLCTMGIKPKDVRPHDKPDVLVSIAQTSNSELRRIGIEVRTHYVDENHGQGSGGQRLVSFWKKIQQLINELKQDHPELLKFHAFLFLKKNELSKKSLDKRGFTENFAREVATFVLKKSDLWVSEKLGSDIITVITLDQDEKEFQDFSGYKLLEKYVKQVIVRKLDIDCSWEANVHASGIGIDIKQLIRIIADKNRKARSYDTKRININELWLLIAAPHTNVYSSMHNFPRRIDFKSPDILKMCNDTPFNKIFFWSSTPHEWHRQIWPPTS